MKVKVSDYIAEFMAQKGITNVFTVCGGGSMHMNDSFGHHPKLRCIYNHHEQASAIAAEGYARIHNKPAICCVTSGPGAINALNGVVGAYQDSIPMLVFSGQTKTTLTTRLNHLPLRSLGNQEVDIVSALTNFVKYAVMVERKEQIRYVLERAYAEATSGRMGPAWVDIPLDIQGAYVDPDDLVGYEGMAPDMRLFSETKLEKTAQAVIEKLKKAKRPVIYAGNGIRLSGGVEILRNMAREFGIPVVTCWDSIDEIATDDRYYCGRGGNMGDRPGNFAVQNSDLLICIGTRLNIYQVGFDVNLWARDAYVVVDDIDADELRKPIMRADLPVCADASAFMNALVKAYRENPCEEKKAWVDQCVCWKKKYPVVQNNQKEQKDICNVYAFIDALSRELPEKAVTVVANGSASVVGSAAYYIKEHDRFIMNCSLSSMGYDLPAAIGACVANNYEDVVCIAGDGSIQMNLQELQTIVTNKLPIKIFVINNAGYHQMRLTEKNLFKDGMIGVGPETGDLGFPDFEKLAYAYGIPYSSIHTNSELKENVQKTLQAPGYQLCEVYVDTVQKFEPKSATMKRPDGSLVSPPLEDLAPFISRDELAENMYIPMMKEI